MTFGKNGVKTELSGEIDLCQVNTIENDKKIDLQGELSNKEKGVAYLSIEFDDQYWAISSELQTIVESYFFNESINELNVNVVSMKELCSISSPSPCVEESLSEFKVSEKNIVEKEKEEKSQVKSMWDGMKKAPQLKKFVKVLKVKSLSPRMKNKEEK